MFEETRQYLLQLEMQMSEAKVRMAASQEKFKAATKRREELSNAVSEAKRDYRECVNESSTEDKICQQLISAFEQLKRDSREFVNNEFAEMQSAAEEANTNFELASDRYKIQQNRYSDGIEPIMQLMEQLDRLRHSAMAMYSEYSHMEGAVGQLLWTVPWDQVVENYRDLNPYLRVSWLPLPIKEAELVGTVKAQNTVMDVGTISAIKSSSIPA